MQLSSKTKGTLIALLMVVAAALACWVYQLVNGLSVTGMNNATSWGTYIAFFMLFVGLSAGGLIVASSAHVFGIESFKVIAKPAVILSTVCICCAGMFIMIDLGGIQRIWRMLLSPNPTSPLVWDMAIITTYLVINILDLVWLTKGDEEKVRKLSYVALPVAILVHSVTAWIFGLQIGRDWYSAIMAPIFVASALDSGMALLIVSVIGLEKAGLVSLQDDLVPSLARLLNVFIAVDAFFIGCELLTMGYPGASEANALAIMTTGATAPFFWFEIVCGLLIPFLILTSDKNRRKPAFVVVASLLVVLGVVCKRIWLLFTSFVEPNVQGALGITLGNHNVVESTGSMWSVFGTYAPTPVEIVIVAGVICLGIAVFIILTSKLCGNKNA